MAAIQRQRKQTARKSREVAHEQYSYYVNVEESHILANNNDSDTDNMSIIRLTFYTALIAISLIAIFLLSLQLGIVLGNYSATHNPSTPTNSLRKDKHRVAGLNCADHGGPKNKQILDEMIYWKDIPSDAAYLSPMHPLHNNNDNDSKTTTERYLSFETDPAGWNNRRMAFETAVVMAHAMGRTLVLPPDQSLRNVDLENLEEQQSVFGFQDFFHLGAISKEQRGLNIITMDEFLEREVITGKLFDIETNKVMYPPWENGMRLFESGKGTNHLSWIWYYLREVGHVPEWNPLKCALAIPASTNPDSVKKLKAEYADDSSDWPELSDFIGNPTPVNASLSERMKEMLASKDDLCIYDKALQQMKLIHLKVDYKVRFLTFFYAFLFYEDWRQDVWSKRFVRDHLRYSDSITCAAARVVEALRDHARNNNKHNASRVEGVFDAMHVRRGDFEVQYRSTQLSAEDLLERAEELQEGATLYIATDEKNRDFFEPFKQKYDVVFLEDFAHVLTNVNTNLYPMIEQLVCSKSRIFYGTYSSTFSGYINRLRGYHVTKNKVEGYKDGTMKSWYFTPKTVAQAMRKYHPVSNDIFGREYPTAWRDIDVGVEELSAGSSKGLFPWK